MKKISVAIATFNEEKNIGRCLASVYSWVDEIILVDGSSQDKTVEIAKKFNAKIIVTYNQIMFHLNKQKAIDACRGEWILQLDADEEVTKELSLEITNTIRRQSFSKIKRSNNGYWIPRKNYFLGKWLSKGGQYPDYMLRLYRRGKGRLPCLNVHEQAEVSGNIGYLENPLIHHPYASFSEYLEHFNRYTDIFADEYGRENLDRGFTNFINYVLIKPILWFFITYIRHKGFMDGIPGFIFSFCSSMRFPISYIKYCDKKLKPII